jgi:hypothetical protein
MQIMRRESPRSVICYGPILSRNMDKAASQKRNRINGLKVCLWRAFFTSLGQSSAIASWRAELLFKYLDASPSIPAALVRLTNWRSCAEQGVELRLYSLAYRYDPMNDCTEDVNRILEDEIADEAVEAAAAFVTFGGRPQRSSMVLIASLVGRRSAANCG